MPVITDVIGSGAKEEGWDRSESVWFRSHAEKYIDWTGKARGLQISVSSQLREWKRPGSVKKIRWLLIQLQSVHLDVAMKSTQMQLN